MDKKEFAVLVIYNLWVENKIENDVLLHALQNIRFVNLDEDAKPKLNEGEKE